MLTEYDKLTIGDTITINLKDLAKDNRFKEKEETTLFLDKLKLKDLKPEYIIGEGSEEDIYDEKGDYIYLGHPFIAVYLFGLLDGYQKLDLYEEAGELTKLHKVRYYHHNVVSKYVERGLEEFLEIISEMEEQFRSSRKMSLPRFENEE